MGGAPISFVQQLLGHESLQTTGIYTQLTDAMTKEIARRVPTAIEERVKEVGPRDKTLREARASYGVEAAEWEVFLEALLGEPF